MYRSPLPFLLILLFIRNQSNMTPPVINTLQIEAFLDNAKQMMDTIDRVSKFAQNGLPNALNLQKLLDSAGPLLTAMNSEEKND